ncbi:hypothetical protein BGZ60DRAFT_156046 [Tricladium varicosporioides]|nr:hypothetical protein BGZ60DRAFT_156046 [Hymenoscyphus varicosporioides]
MQHRWALPRFSEQLLEGIGEAIYFDVRRCTEVSYQFAGCRVPVAGRINTNPERPLGRVSGFLRSDSDLRYTQHSLLPHMALEKPGYGSPKGSSSTCAYVPLHSPTEAAEAAEAAAKCVMGKSEEERCNNTLRSHAHAQSDGHGYLFRETGFVWEVIYF